ncbi:MAG: NAD(+) synthase, partial [Agathobacter sp.]|nr:NAD(+) synthase [Agathobacter sp.]
MKHGFVKVAAVTPKIKVADTIYNGQQIRLHMDEAVQAGAKVVVFPELCITGCTCGDLFFHDALLRAAKKELLEITDHSRYSDAIFFVGLPYEIDGKLYNMAAVICGGEILGLVPKTYIPGHHESYETRYFASGAYLDTEEVLKGDDILMEDQVVTVGTDLIFCCSSL